MGVAAKKFRPFSYHTWTVRMNPTAHEGRSVWENCPVPDGIPVLLTVQTLPPMLISIGQAANRRQDQSGVVQWVNKAIVRTGAFPSSYAPLSVGCALNVIPGWQLALIESVPAIVAPTFGSSEGVDVRPLQGNEVDRLQVWVSTDRATSDLIAPRVWLRHPSGLWSEAQLPAGGATTVLQSFVFDISVRNADRCLVSFDFAGGPPPSGSPVKIAYGNMTAPVEQYGQKFNVRFGAVVAPTLYSR